MKQERIKGGTTKKCEECKFYAQNPLHINVLEYTDRIHFLQIRCNDLMKQNAELKAECARMKGAVR